MHTQENDDRVVQLFRQPTAAQLHRSAAQFPELYHSSLRGPRSAATNPSPSTGAGKDGTYSEQLRLHRRQHRIGIACIALAAWIVLYFIAQLARAVF